MSTADELIAQLGKALAASRRGINLPDGTYFERSTIVDFVLDFNCHYRPDLNIVPHGWDYGGKRYRLMEKNGGIVVLPPVQGLGAGFSDFPCLVITDVGCSDSYASIDLETNYDKLTLAGPWLTKGIALESPISRMADLPIVIKLTAHIYPARVWLKGFVGGC